MFPPKSFIVLALIYDAFWVNLGALVWGRDPISFLCIWIFSCPLTICWKDYQFFHWIVLESLIQKCKDLFQDSVPFHWPLWLSFWISRYLNCYSFVFLFQDCSGYSASLVFLCQIFYHFIDCCKKQLGFW